MFFGTYTPAETREQSKTDSARVPLPSSANWPVVLKPDDALWPMPSPTPTNNLAWTLTLEGAVKQPLTLTYKELLALPQAYQNRRILSSEQWSYRCEWEGVTVSQLLKTLELEPDVHWVKQTNKAGYIQWISLADLLNQNALLGLRAQAQPLDWWVGGPVRLLVFDRYWHRGLGQLTRLEFFHHLPEGLNPADEGQAPFEPADYYAFDLKEIRRFEQPGEVTYC